MDYDDFLISYHRDDPGALEFIEMAETEGGLPRTRDQYKNMRKKLRAKIAAKRASELMSTLAGNILSKSSVVDNLVSNLPGIDRTKEEQMERISELIDQNQKADEELQEMYKNAEMKRDKIRSVLDKTTCSALGISEES